MKKYIIVVLALLVIPSMTFGSDSVSAARTIMLEERVKALENLVNNLDTKLNSKIDQVDTKIDQVDSHETVLSKEFGGHVLSATPVSVIQSVDQTNKINDLDKRVSYLEKAMSSLQDKVLTGINKMISILGKLLK